MNSNQSERREMLLVIIHQEFQLGFDQHVNILKLHLHNHWTMYVADYPL